jgi:MoxR-like ATPase
MWTPIASNNQYVSTTPQDDAVATLAAGRAWLCPSQPADAGPADVGNIATRLNALAAAVDAQFVGTTDFTNAIATSLAVGEHTFAYGPPGTAKSSIARAFAAGIGGTFWRGLFNPDTTREEVFGPVDPAAYRENGRWTRRWSGLANANIALLDEFFKASSQVANMCLDALEERRVSSAEGDRQLPLVSAIIASNEIPEDKERQAVYDRLLVRVPVAYVSTAPAFRALFSAQAGRVPIAPTLDSDELLLLAAYAEAVAMNPPAPLVDGLTELWQETRPLGVALSNRRWVRTAKLAVGASLLAGQTPDTHHLSVARWTLWTDPDEAADIGNLVLGLTDPVAGDVLDLEALLADLVARQQEIAADGALELQPLARLVGTAKSLANDADTLASQAGAQPYQDRLTKIHDQAMAVADETMDLFANASQGTANG